MLTLSRTGRFETLGDASPFVCKLETWLRMADISFESKVGSPMEMFAEAPKNLIPFVYLDGNKIGDSSVIIDRLKAQFGDPLNDARLSESERALGALLKSVCEYELLKIMVYGRWIDGDVEAFATFILRDLPKEQLPAAIEQATKRVVSGGILYRTARYDADSVRALLREKLDAISHYLGNKPFLFGDEPCTTDAGLYSALASFIDFPLPNPHVQIAREYASLVDYCHRIKEQYHFATDWVQGA